MRIPRHQAFDVATRHNRLMREFQGILARLPEYAPRVGEHWWPALRRSTTLVILEGNITDLSAKMERIRDGLYAAGYADLSHGLRADLPVAEAFVANYFRADLAQATAPAITPDANYFRADFPQATAPAIAPAVGTSALPLLLIGAAIVALLVLSD